MYSLEGFEPTAEAVRHRLHGLGAGKDLDAHMQHEADEDLKEFISGLTEWEVMWCEYSD